MRYFIYLCCTVLAFYGGSASADSSSDKKSNIAIVISKDAHQRIQFGAEKLAEALNQAGYKARVEQQNKCPSRNNTILITEKSQAQAGQLLKQSGIAVANLDHKEGFSISTSSNNRATIVGSDVTGALYGCLELVDQVNATGKLPQNLTLNDHPEMVLR